MAKPTQSIFPVENGKLITNLDCNNLQLINLDESNLSGGGGGSGNDTGTTTAILKGDGNHGFADAIPGTDYATSAQVQVKEDTTSHDADMAILTGLISTNTDDITNLTIEVNNKADASDTTAALALKADKSVFDAYVASNDAEVALKAYSSDVTSALSFKADTSLVTTGLALKEPLLPASPANGYILSRDLDQSWHFVDPISLGGGGGGGGGTGTVTSVGFNQGSWTDLFSSTVTNASSSAVINIVQNTTVGANRFYGNFTAFAGTAAFGTAGTARTALGGTTVGQAIFQLANPSQVGFIRTNVDNSVTALTSAATLTALGAESALTFSAPLNRVVNTVSMPPSGATVSGYLSASDWVAFNAKVPGGRTINTTAPLTIAGVSGIATDLSVDRVIAMPPATDIASGHLTAADHATFVAKPPNTRTISTTAPLTGGGDLSANRTFAIPKATSLVDGYLAASDFSAFFSGSPHTDQVGNVTSWVVTAPTTRVVLTQTLTGALAISLPNPNLYSNTTTQGFIEFVDVANPPAMSNAGITLVAAGGTTVDGATVLTLARGTGYLRLNSNGGTRWTSSKYFVDAFKDPSDPTKVVRVSVSALPTATTRVFSPASAGDSVSVALPIDSFPDEAVRGIGSDGVLSHSPITGDQVIPGFVTVVGTADSTISTTPGGKDVTVVAVVTALTANRNYTIPDARNYDSGQEIVFFDTTGNPNGFNAKLIATSPNSINGAGTFDINDGAGKYFRRSMNADPSGSGAWTIAGVAGTPSSGLTYAPWTPISIVSGAVTLPCSNAYLEQHHTVTLSGGNASLAFTAGSVQIGMTGRVKFRQDVTGGRSITALPTGSKTPTAGAGLFTLSSGSNAEDEFGWDFDGVNYNWYPLGLNFTAAAAPSFGTTDWDNITATTTTGATKQGNANAQKFVAGRFLADGGLADGSNYTIGKQTLRLYKTGSPTYNLTVACWSDNGASQPNAQIGSASTAVLASTLGQDAVLEGSVDFNANFSVTGARQVTAIATTNLSKIITGAVGKFLPGDVMCYVTGTGLAAGARIDTVAVDGSSATLNLNCTSTNASTTVTVRHPYWLVITGDNASQSTVNNINWAFSAVANSGNVQLTKSASGSWVVVTGGSTQGYRFTLFKQ